MFGMSRKKTALLAAAAIAAILLLGWKSLFGPMFAKKAPAGTNQPPVAELATTPSPAEGEEPLEVEFDASASSDPDGKIRKFFMDFGDGSKPVEKKKVKHTYRAAVKGADSTYTATITVTDTRDAAASKTVNITVKAPKGPTPPPAANLPPVAKFRFSQLAGSIRTMEFVSESTDPEGGLLVVTWDFGDKTPKGGDLARIPHQYAAAGTYTVTMTATDDKVATASASLQVTVVDKVPPPVPPTPPAGGDALDPFRDKSATPPADPLEQFRNK